MMYPRLMLLRDLLRHSSTLEAYLRVIKLLRRFLYRSGQ